MREHVAVPEHPTGSTKAERGLVSRILLLNAVLLGVAMAAIAVVLVWSNLRVLKMQSTEHADALATYIASQSEYPLAIADNSMIGSIVYHAFADQSVIAIRLANASGKEILGVVRPTLEAADAEELKKLRALRTESHSERTLTSTSAIAVMRPISSQDGSAAGSGPPSRLGTVELVVSMPVNGRRSEDPSWAPVCSASL